MRPAGLLVFTVEQADPAETKMGYRLHPQGRYSHSRSYVEKALEQAGFHTVVCRPEILRLEMKVPVAGLLVTARR